LDIDPLISFSFLDHLNNNHNQKFLDSYSLNLNGTRQKNIKKFFIQYLKLLYKNKRLQDDALLLPSNNTCNIDQLNSMHLRETIIVFENINLSFTCLNCKNTVS